MDRRHAQADAGRRLEAAFTGKKLRNLTLESNQESELVNRALAGDAQARTEIVLKYQELVYNLGLKLLNNPGEAENILQETFLKIFEKLLTFKGRASLQTWIYRIATNEALMILRKRKGEPVSIDEDPDEEQKQRYRVMLQSLDRNPLELLMNAELKKALEDAMVELPDSWRIPFVLKDIEGLSLQEVAETLNTTVPAVKAALHRGRSALRDKLAEYTDRREEGSR